MSHIHYPHKNLHINVVSRFMHNCYNLSRKKQGVPGCLTLRNQLPWSLQEQEGRPWSTQVKYLMINPMGFLGTLSHQTSWHSQPILLPVCWQQAEARLCFRTRETRVSGPLGSSYNFIWFGSRSPDQSQASKLVSQLSVPDSLQLHGPEPSGLLCPLDFPGKNLGVGCHFLLHHYDKTEHSNFSFVLKIMTIIL